MWWKELANSNDPTTITWMRSLKNGVLTPLLTPILGFCFLLCKMRELEKVACEVASNSKRVMSAFEIQDLFDFNSDSLSLRVKWDFHCVLEKDTSLQGLTFLICKSEDLDNLTSKVPYSSKMKQGLFKPLLTRHGSDCFGGYPFSAAPPRIRLLGCPM